MAIAWDSRAPLTAEEATALGVTGTSDQVAAAVNAALYKLEDACGIAFIAKAYTERHRGGGVIFLRHYPVASITSIVDEGTNVQTIAAADYHLIKDTGVLRYGYGGGAFPTAYTGALVGEWVVTLSAGWFANLAAVTWDVKDAVAAGARMVRYNMTAGITELDGGDLRVKFDTSQATPEPIRRLLATYKIRLVA